MSRAALRRAAQPAAEPAGDVVLRRFERSLPMLLLRGHQAVMAEFRPILREHGITEQQWRVLRALDGVPSQRISQLSAATLISGPSLTRILRALEDAKLIRRTAEAGDQRAARISMLPAARRLIDTVAPRSEERYAQIAARYGQRDLEQLYDMLQRLPPALRRRP